MLSVILEIKSSDGGESSSISNVLTDGNDQTILDNLPEFYEEIINDADEQQVKRDISNIEIKINSLDTEFSTTEMRNHSFYNRLEQNEELRRKILMEYASHIFMSGKVSEMSEKFFSDMWILIKFYGDNDKDLNIFSMAESIDSDNKDQVIKTAALYIAKNGTD